MNYKNLEIFLDELQKQDGLISEFDPLLWNSLVDYVTVFEKDEVQIIFKIELIFKHKDKTPHQLLTRWVI